MHKTQDAYEAWSSLSIKHIIQDAYDECDALCMMHTVKNAYDAWWHIQSRMSLVYGTNDCYCNEKCLKKYKKCIDISIAWLFSHDASI